MLAELQGFHTALKMKNKSKAAKAIVPNLPSEPISEAEQSLKSARNSQAHFDSGGVPVSLQNEMSTPQGPVILSVWKCPTCATPNEFGASEQCSSCKFNLNYFDGDIT